MKENDTLISYLNELNQSGKIRYDDYSRLFDMACELGNADAVLSEATEDIAALLWLSGNCEYCRYGRKEEFGGASRWTCAHGAGSDCRPAWRGPQNTGTPFLKAEPMPKQQPKQKSRVERMFGPKDSWGQEQKAAGQKPYRGFLLMRCRECGKLRGFHAKVPITEYRCECGGVTPVANLRPLHLRCKCGKHFMYRTNVVEDTLTYGCLACGAPVDLEYNPKSDSYETVR